MDHPLKVARKRLNLNQAQAAVLLDTTQASISKYESGEVTPSTEVAAKLAAKLGMSELELLYPERYGFAKDDAPAEQRAA